MPFNGTTIGNLSYAVGIEAFTVAQLDAARADVRTASLAIAAAKTAREAAEADLVASDTGPHRTAYTSATTAETAAHTALDAALYAAKLALIDFDDARAAREAAQAAILAP